MICIFIGLTTCQNPLHYTFKLSEFLSYTSTKQIILNAFAKVFLPLVDNALLPLLSMYKISFKLLMPYKK
jgi:hypothetical protein